MGKYFEEITLNDIKSFVEGKYWGLMQHMMLLELTKMRLCE